MSRKKLIRGLLLAGWCVIIFSFSSQSGGSSQHLSDGLLRFLPFASLPGAGVLIRKAAHFCEYFILAFFAFLFFQEEGQDHPLRFLGFSFLYACSDELHQLLVGGRSGQLKDVLLDMGGALCFYLLLRLYRRLRARNSRGNP